MEQLIMAIALSQGVDPTLLMAVCYNESRLQNVHIQDGHSMSFGVCQVKNVAASQVGLKGIDLTEPTNSILVAAKYVKYTITKCNSISKGLGMYNSGKCINIHSYVSNVLLYKDMFDMKYQDRLILRSMAHDFQ